MIRRLIQSVLTLKKNNTASVAITFALALVAILGLGGLFINYQNVKRYEARLVSASDAALIGAIKYNGTLQEKNAEGVKIFNSNLGDRDPDSTASISFTVRSDGAGLNATVTARTPMLLGGVVGQSHWDIEFATSAVRDIPGKLELSLALDTTFSMTGARMTALKKAANDLVDSLSKASTYSGQIKIAIVPFDVYVNVGVSNRTASWLDVPADAVAPTYVLCPTNVDMSRYSGCWLERTPAVPAQPDYSCRNDGVKQTCKGAPAQPAVERNVCPARSGVPVDALCEVRGGYVYAKWEGCVGSRSFPLDTTDSNFGTRIPGLVSGGGVLSCASPILPLTSDFAAAKTKLNSLIPQGETYTPAGLLWAWYTLTPGQPFSAQTITDADPVKKYLVLMTDGANTGVPNYPHHNGNPSNLAETDKVFRSICDNISADKENKITVSTIGFELTDANSKKLLSDCARKNNGQYYDSTDVSKLKEAFDQILSGLIQVRLVR
ncbi:MAG: hypothetical protein CFE31_17535 [Rhizobiales bacterium PAR1]|nr:MAG: hypothetical protein CFE31_17535 [Rhizobiales bacterium PAR1]